MRTLWKAVLLAALAIALVAVFAPPGALATSVGTENSLLTVAAGAATNDIERVILITREVAYAEDVGVAGTSVMMTAIGVPQALRHELAGFTNYNSVAGRMVMKHPIVVAVVRAIDATPSVLGVPNRGVCPNAAAAFARA